MINIRPFKAIKPKKDKASLVVSRSYEDYTDEELNAVLNYNPYSFLHIINPGYKFNHKSWGMQRYNMVRNRFLEFLDEGIITKDSLPSIYIYKIKTLKNSFCGFIAAASVSDYNKKYIKKHEATIKKREALFKKYLNEVRFNAESVLLTYPDNEEIAKVLEACTQKTPEYTFSTPDKTTHYLWCINDTKLITKIQTIFKSIDAVYIADGHHRSASSALLASQLNTKNKDQYRDDSPHNYFMSYFIPESNLKIYEFNRIIKDLNGYTKEDFLIKLDKYFRIEHKGTELYKPSKVHHFSMYLDGAFYSLYLRKQYEFKDAVSELDTQILYETVLKPILGIDDLRDDSRIRYGYGKNNSMEMKNLIDNETYKVGFCLFPVSVEQLKKVSDQNLVMPPKSTFIEPKLKSGLTIYEF